MTCCGSSARSGSTTSSSRGCASAASRSSTPGPAGRGARGQRRGRARLIELVASEYIVGASPRRRGASGARGLPARRLARHLIGGLTVAESGLDIGALAGRSLIAAAIDDDAMFVLPPLPNTLFTRDSSCWIYGGVSINPMFWPARRREAYNMAAIYRAHPMFTEADFDFWYPPWRGRPVRDRGLRPRIARGRRREIVGNGTVLIGL